MDSEIKFTVNYVLNWRKEFDNLVNDTHNVLLAQNDIDGAFDAYLKLCEECVYRYSEYSSSTPFSEHLPGYIGECPYDDFHIDRHQIISWTKIYGMISRMTTANISDWKRAVMQSKTTHYRCDW